MKAAQGRRWWSFLAWALAGAGYGLVISVIGLLTIPAAIFLTLALTWRRRTGREMLGLLEGLGGIGVLVGAINLDYHPCSSNGTIALSPGQSGFSCGGFDGLPWLIAGLAVMVAVLFTYWLLTRPPQRQLESEHA